MPESVFFAGTQPGSPTTEEEVRVLICYLLSQLSGQMSFYQLHEALLENGLVNYFELVSAMQKLTATGHVAKNDDALDGDTYCVTDIGIEAAAQFSRTLPASVREKAVKASQRLLKREKREGEISMITTPQDGGYLVELALPDSSSPLASFSVFAPTKEHCQRIKRNFFNDPAYIYKVVLAVLTGDAQVIEDIFPSGENIF